MIGEKFASLTIMHNENTDMDSMITTFNTSRTETASEIIGKHRQKKKPWVTAETLDLCDKRRVLRKKRFESKDLRKTRSEQQHQEVHEKGTRNLDRRTVY